MVRAHACLARERGERQDRVRRRLDPAQRRRDAPLVARGRSAPAAAAVHERRRDRAGRAQGELLELAALALLACRLGRGEERDEGRQRRQPRQRETRLPGAGHRGDDLLEMIRRELEGEAAIAGRVLMAAFETGAFVAEQHCAGGEHRVPLRGAVLERAFGHERDAGVVVPLLEDGVAGTGGADDLAHLPAGAGGEEARGRGHAGRIAIFPKPRRGATR
jgi:hypothetical protein